MNNTIAHLREALHALEQSERLAQTNKILKGGQGTWNDQLMESIIANTIANNTDLMALCKEQAAVAILSIIESSLKFD